jgi:hypothetical protein
MKTDKTNAELAQSVSHYSSSMGIAVQDSLATKLKLNPEMKAAITEVVEETIKRALQPGGILYRR